VHLSQLLHILTTPPLIRGN